MVWSYGCLLYADSTPRFLGNMYSTVHWCLRSQHICWMGQDINECIRYVDAITLRENFSWRRCMSANKGAICFCGATCFLWNLSLSSTGSVVMSLRNSKWYKYNVMVLPEQKHNWTKSFSFYCSGVFAHNLLALYMHFRFNGVYMDRQKHTLWLQLYIWRSDRSSWLL